MRRRGPWRASGVAIAAIGVALSGCAAGRSAQKTVTGWFGAGSAGAPAAAPRAQTRYAAAAGVQLHRGPDAASEVVGELALHEAVLRDRLANGFAHVKSRASGRVGWVHEQELIARLPVEDETATPEEAAPESDPSGTDEPPETPEKSVFDPY
jgi:hypothetical protein